MFLLPVQKEPKYGRGYPDTPIDAPEKDMLISFGMGKLGLRRYGDVKASTGSLRLRERAAAGTA